MKKRRKPLKLLVVSLLAISATVVADEGHAPMSGTSLDGSLGWEVMPTIVVPGASAGPPPVAPFHSDPYYIVSPGESSVTTFGVDLSGVGSLTLTRTTGTVLCTGALLSTGKHILTAAHCVADDGSGADILLSGSVSFNGLFPPTSIIGATIHPLYSGLPVTDGYDIAVLELGSMVDPSIERYDIMTSKGPGFDVGVDGVIAGYGNRGTGDVGQTTSTLGTLRAGKNLIEATGTQVDILFGAADPEGVLYHDFDNGMAANDAFDFFGPFFTPPTTADLGMGVDEVHFAEGDSGGPTFVDDGGVFKIASVVSSGLRVFLSPPPMTGTDPMSSDVDLDLNFSFGEFGAATRVAHHAAFINQAMGVPEPSSYLLLAAMLLPALRRRKRPLPKP